jgi:hypothetical protein
VYIQDGGRIYKPSVDLVQELMSIPDSFDVSWMAKEQARNAWTECGLQIAFSGHGRSSGSPECELRSPYRGAARYQK